MNARARRTRRTALAAAAAAAVVLAGLLLGPACEEAQVGGPRDEDAASDGSGDGAGGRPDVSGPLSVTTVREDGNRLFAGSLDLAAAVPLDVPLGDALPGSPRWVLGAALPDGSLWVVVDQYGTAAAWTVRAGRAAPVFPAPEGLPPGTPPVLWLADGAPRLLAPPPGAAPLAPPLPRAVGGWFAWIGAADGRLILAEGQVETHLVVSALPDARIVRFGADCVALLGGATDAYAHGVLGDALEGTAVVLVCGAAAPRVRWAAGVPLPRVTEALAPLVADIDDDGAAELVVTESDPTEGARIVALDAEGARLAEGPPVGEGGRWRHAIAVAPFAPDGVPEIAVVRAPDGGGVVEFWRRAGAALVLAASLGTYTSHVFGSRNLDMALAGDLDGDRRPELLVLTTDRRELVVLDRTADGVAERARVPVGGVVATNLAVSAHGRDGRPALAAAREDGVLRLWLPPAAAAP